MSTTYLRDADNGYSAGYVYGRTDNVSVQQAESLIAALEGADEALMFGSGMAAATAVFLALDKPTHIIASQVMYWGFRSWLRDIGRYGHCVTFVETSDLDAVRAAVRPGRDRPVLDRDAEQSAVDHDRHRRGRRNRACGRRPALRRLRRSRRRSSPGRSRSAPTSSCIRRPNISTAIPTWSPARSPPRDDDAFWERIRKMRAQHRRHAGPVRGLAADARHAHARCARAGAGADRGLLAERLGRSSGGRAKCSIPA